MNENFKIDIKNGKNGYKTIRFGVPSNKHELDQMFTLRHKVYSKRGLIESISSTRGFDKDFYDENNRSFYFIASVDDIVIGSTRMIFGDILPTEDRYFKLEMPTTIQNIHKSQKVEIGRLSSYPQQVNIKIPRHLVLLGLFFSMTKFAEEKKYILGIGTLKDYVKTKLNKIDFPLHAFKNHKYIYDPISHNDPIANFFSPETGPIWPIYCYLTEVKNYLHSLFFNKICFSIISENHIRLRSNFFFKLSLIKNSVIRFSKKQATAEP